MNFMVFTVSERSWVRILRAHHTREQPRRSCHCHRCASNPADFLTFYSFQSHVLQIAVYDQLTVITCGLLPKVQFQTADCRVVFNVLYSSVAFPAWVRHQFERQFLIMLRCTITVCWLQQLKTQFLFRRFVLQSSLLQRMNLLWSSLTWVASATVCLLNTVKSSQKCGSLVLTRSANDESPHIDTLKRTNEMHIPALEATF